MPEKFWEVDFPTKHLYVRSGPEINSKEIAKERMLDMVKQTIEETIREIEIPDAVVSQQVEETG